ncbi:MAG TPA: glycoside hydrolase family 38 C-terminal domain-containing protein [Candidatus Acidoferrales bacterium]|nr:glycoside hydrolase family 38 C-terminal domain-containing protein [Candidatus Acidoferrales bacterium]
MPNRRAFLVSGLALAAYPLAGRAQRARVALATYSHIDVAWRWPLQEGLQQSDSTFRSVLRVLDTFPQLKFSETSASYYAWIRTTDPPTFARIADMVKQGRWEPIGGWWTEADVNIISGESLMRQAYFGLREFREHLGVATAVAFLPDSFGSSANLPAILRASGLQYYVMGRGTFSAEPLPRAAFTWKSLGDSSVLVYNNPVSGGTNDAVETVEKAADLQNDLLVWFGLGDHGGGPTIESLRKLESYLQTPEAPDVEFTAVEPYLRSAGRPPLTCTGEIEGVFPGAYTNCYDMKRSMIDAERALLDCERYDVLASLCGVDLPTPSLDELWESLLLNQHHDTISATGLEQNVSAAISQNRAVATRAAEIARPYLESIVDRIPHSPEDEAALVVFNPLPHPVRAAATYPLSAPPGRVPVLLDYAGAEVAAQSASADPLYPDHSPPTIFAVELPAFGYASYRATGTRPHVPPPANVLPTHLSIGGYTVTLDRTTGLPLTLRGSNDVQTFGRAGFAVFTDRGDTWASDGLPTYPPFGFFDLHDLVLDEWGPVRVVAKATHVFRSSRIDTRIEVRNGERAVRFTADIDWKERFMRAAFSFDLPGASASYDIPFGVIERRSAPLTQPGISFVARNRATAGVVGLVTCGNHGFWASDTTLGVSLVRSTAFSALDHADYGISDLQDTGRRRISFMLCLCDDLAELTRTADAFERWFPVLWNGTHDGDAALSATFADVPENLTVASLRRVADVSEARVHELAGNHTTSTLRIGSASGTTALDPYGIRTLQVRGGSFEDVTPQ